MSQTFRSDHKYIKEKIDGKWIPKCSCGWKGEVPNPNTRDKTREMFGEHKKSFPIKEMTTRISQGNLEAKIPRLSKRKTIESFEDEFDPDIDALFALNDKEGIILDFLSLYNAEGPAAEELEIYIAAKYSKQLMKKFQDLISENIKRIVKNADSKKIKKQKIQMELKFSGK